MRPGDFDKTRLHPMRVPKMPIYRRGHFRWVLALVTVAAAMAVWAAYGWL